MFPNLLIEMKKTNYTQKELAKYIGITEHSMSLKMNEKVAFTLPEAMKIKSAFQRCSLEYLFECYEKKE